MPLVHPFLDIFGCRAQQSSKRLNPYPEPSALSLIINIECVLGSYYIVAIEQLIAFWSVVTLISVKFATLQLWWRLFRLVFYRIKPWEGCSCKGNLLYYIFKYKSFHGTFSPSTKYMELFNVIITSLVGLTALEHSPTVCRIRCNFNSQRRWTWAYTQITQPINPVKRELRRLRTRVGKAGPPCTHSTLL